MDRFCNLRSHLQIQFRLEPDHSEHTHRIFGKPGADITDYIQCTCLDVFHSPDKIKYNFLTRIIIKRIDCEIPAHGIGVYRTIDIVVENPAAMDGLVSRISRLVATLRRGAVSRDFDHFPIAPALAKGNMDQFESPADDSGAVEQFFDLFRPGVGGNIKILGATIQQ